MSDFQEGDIYRGMFFDTDSVIVFMGREERYYHGIGAVVWTILRLPAEITSVRQALPEHLKAAQLCSMELIGEKQLLKGFKDYRKYKLVEAA